MEMDNKLDQYLLNTLDPKEKWVKELETKAKNDHIPIMEPLGIDFLMQIIRMYRPTRILEIGTAIGYSALRMLEAYSACKIVSIERDKERFQQAVSAINSLGKQENIEVILGDALEKAEMIEKKGPYDMVFIDAAKGQYQRFFEIYSEYLTKNGMIITDNVLFKGYVAEEYNENKKYTGIAKKIHKYNEWLVNHPNYKTTIVPIGDGIALSVKR